MTLRVQTISPGIHGNSDLCGFPCTSIRIGDCYGDDGSQNGSGPSTPYEELSVDAAVERALIIGYSLVEITGVEPLNQNAVHELLRRLCDAGKTVVLESQGGHDLEGIDSRVRVSMEVSRGDDMMSMRNAALAAVDQLGEHDELRFVIENRADYEFARDKIAEHDLNDRCVVRLVAPLAKLDPRQAADWMLADHLQVRLTLKY